METNSLRDFARLWALHLLARLEAPTDDPEPLCREVERLADFVAEHVH